MRNSTATATIRPEYHYTQLQWDVINTQLTSRHQRCSEYSKSEYDYEYISGGCMVVSIYEKAAVNRHMY